MTEFDYTGYIITLKLYSSFPRNNLKILVPCLIVYFCFIKPVCQLLHHSFTPTWCFYKVHTGLQYQFEFDITLKLTKKNHRIQGFIITKSQVNYPLQIMKWWE